ncbi:MAG: hypothetical protein WBB28_08705 [Crinalium sp.]
MNQVKGFPCPECAGFIPVSPAMLLGSQDSVYCPSCGLKLTINRAQSKEELEQYQQLMEVIKKSEEKIERAKG